MKIELPGKDNRWVQINKGDYSGNVWSSWNLDLDSNPGTVRVSPATTIVTSSATNTNSSLLVYPVAFCRTSADGNDSVWALCDHALYKHTGSNFTPDIGSSTGTPTTSLSYLYSDMVEFNSWLVVSLNGTEIVALKPTNPTAWDTTWWTTSCSGSALTVNVPHPLCVGFDDKLLIGNGNVIAQATKLENADDSILTLPSNFEVIWIRSSKTEYWIGCRNKRGKNGKVFTWDGYSEDTTGQYEIGSSECLAGCIKDDICFVLNSLGQILQFNGAGFSELGRLPIMDSSKRWVNDNHLQVHQRGMGLIDNKIHILLNADLGGYNNYNEFLQNMLSGIWCFDPDKGGFYHKYSITKKSGDVVDYGSPIIVQSGGLMDLSSSNLSTLPASAKFLAGCQLYTQNGEDVSTSIGAVNKLGANTSAKVGYLITPRIPTAEVEENWQKIYLLIKKFLNSTSKIKVKYRTDYKDFGIGQTVGLTGLWTTLNAFTCAATAFTDNAEVGDEIEILTGQGSGMSANITGLNGSACVIDEIMPVGITGYNRIRVSNWKDVGTSVNTQGLRNFELPIDARSSWIQFKLVFFFTGDEELEKLIIKSEPQLRA